MKLIYKYNRPTVSTHGNTSVFLDGKHIGYFMPNRFLGRAIGENYNFVSKDNNYPSTEGSSYTDIKAKIEEFIK